MRASMLIPAVCFASTAYAHAGIWWYDVDGVKYDGYKWWESSNTSQVTAQRKWPSRYPVIDVKDKYMACNNDGLPTSAAFSIPIRAGQTINAHYDKDFRIPGEVDILGNETWPHDTGPTMAYLASCNGPCAAFDPNTDKPIWFKIYEAGLIVPPASTFLGGRWAATDLMDGAPLSTRIPVGLKPGEYLIRHEVIAIHLQMEKQFYPECAQLIVTGDGDAVPGPEYMVSFPGAYSFSDPGLKNTQPGEPDGTGYWPYWTNQSDTTYPIPGPKVWTG